MLIHDPAPGHGCFRPLNLKISRPFFSLFENVIKNVIKRSETCYGATFSTDFACIVSVSLTVLRNFLRELREHKQRPVFVPVTTRFCPIIIISGQVIHVKKSEAFEFGVRGRGANKLETRDLF